MLNDKGPLMFINTVNTQVDDIPQQKVFDSREQKSKQKSVQSKFNTLDKQSASLSFLEERKLNNIIDMYNKNRPVLCNIICGNKEIVGIPFKKDEVKLFVKTSEENVEEVILLQITDIVIIKF